MFALLGPLYLAVAWRAMGRTIGGAVAGYAVVNQHNDKMGSVKALARASLSFFLLPLWAIGMIGSAFDPARRSWLDRVVGSQTPYLVHVERTTKRLPSDWR